ncbi:hypothetical protein FRC03_000504 [Tulasnella sp. 419]|nr:hypothetical protein FRC03_000504 [Tulasnella sp. 419]
MTEYLSTQAAIAASAAVLALAVAKRKLVYYQTDLAKLPKAPGGHWFYGHEKDALDTDCGDWFRANADNLGLTYTMNSGCFGPEMLVTLDPGALNYILSKRVYDYTKSPAIRPVIDRIMGRSIPWAEGEEHRRQRQVLAPVFTAEAVKSVDDDIRSASDKLTASLQSHVQNTLTDASSTVRVNVYTWTSRATLDIIGSIGFGHDFQCGESPEAQAISTSWKRTVELGLGTPGLVAQLILKTFPFITDLPVGAIQAQGEIKTIIKKLAMDIVEGRKGSGVDYKNGKDLLSRLMRLQGEDDMDQLLDHISTFVLVGHETTSDTINYALLELSRHPELQTRLRQELLDFQGSGPGGEPSYEEFQSKLPFLDAVMKEILRLYPTASHTERCALKDDVIPLRFPVTGPSGKKINSVKIKAGQSIVIPTIAINRLETIWGPDSTKFRPERWLDNDLPPPTSLTQGWNGLFSFLEGPRMCIGYRLAVHEFKVILSSLIKHFEFRNTGANVVSRFSSTLQPLVVGEEQLGVQIPLDIKLLD